MNASDQRLLRLEMGSRALVATLIAAVATLAAGAAAWYVLAPLRWPSTEGVVLSSAFVNRSGNDSHGATMRYTYQVNGVWLTGQRLSRFRSAEKYDAGSGQWIWMDRRLVDEHPRGSPIEVFYNPRKPADAVVVAHANMPGVWGAGGVLLVFWGIAGHLWLRSRSSNLTAEEVAEAGWRWSNAA